MVAKKDQVFRQYSVYRIPFCFKTLRFVSFVFSGFFLFKLCLKWFQVSTSVIRNSRFGDFSVLVLLHSYLCQVGSRCLSPFFPSLCYQRQLGVFNQPWTLLVPAPHRVFAWDMCWASPPPQHRLCLWKLQRVRVFSAKLTEMQDQRSEL